jgi:mannose-6-phosphate isomerase-like protein (cupin superfamily)
VNDTDKLYSVIRFDSIDPVACPCGAARRAFAEGSGGAVSLHLVEIREDARTHYHRRQTEIYFVLEGEGAIEVDGDRVPARPGTAVLIRPGCRHRAVGRLKILNVVVPAFDAADEWFDGSMDSE